MSYYTAAGVGGPSCGGGGGGRYDGGNISPVEEESTDGSDEETEPARSFHRRLSTNRDIKCSASLKEGYLLKQTWSFQRWRRRYFKLKGRKLYYAKDTTAVIFDEIELTDLCLAECSTKNVNHSFQLITPFRSLVLCAETRREMEDWLAALNAASQKRFHEPDQPDCLSGYHHWYATSHARPTYCNVCRDALGGVTSHGLSCEVCKCKVHKRCAPKAINNCKWTTLSSVGKEIIEDADGNIEMPHQWMEGNLPVSAKCAICDKNCGSVLRLQDWRCLWCRATVHTQCRPSFGGACPLGVARVSVVPPTALHSIQDEAWEAVRPQASSPLLVFVNSKSGDNQGVKFLRRFKQLLNPAQVFDLISTGPRLGLRLFRHFDPFRILVCSGDGSVGWVLSEIDKLDMHKQCQVAVLPLGTGNDLARVLGWGSSCDDDTHLPQLLEKYEKASTKILDRWSIMAFERTIAMPKLSLTPGQPEGLLHTQIAQYEEILITHLQNILQSDETSVIISSAKRLCETVKDLVNQVSTSPLIRCDEPLSQKCEILQHKLDMLVTTLTSDTPVMESTPSNLQFHMDFEDEDAVRPCGSAGPVGSVSTTKEDTESEMSFEKRSEKSEKDLSNINFRKHRRTSRFVEKEKSTLLARADSLKRAMKNLVDHTEQAVEEGNKNAVQAQAAQDALDLNLKMDSLKVLPTIVDSGSASDLSSCASPVSQSSTVTARLVNISPLPDIRRDSAIEDPELMNLPAPPDFADSRRASQIQNIPVNEQVTEQLLKETCITLAKDIKEIKVECPLAPKDSDSPEDCRNYDEDKECSSILSAMSNEEASIASMDIDRSFCPQKDSDGEDLNGHINHIDSPETDTAPNSDAMQGASLFDDISSMLVRIVGNEYGFDLDSLDTTEEVTAADIERRRSLKYDSMERKRRLSRTSKPPSIEETSSTQFGFENPAFMSQHVYLEQQKTEEQVRYCSLAQFVEGSDIARRSFKRRPSIGSSKLSKTEANVNRQSTLTEEVEPSARGSRSSLNKIEAELIEHDKDEKAESEKFPRVSVVVEPPSPERAFPSIAGDQITIEIEPDFDIKKLLTKAGDVSTSDVSNNSSNSNLLGIDNEHFLTRSPAATRRISCCSMLNPAETAALAAAAATSKFYADSSENKKSRARKEQREREREEIESQSQRKMPIINPLVRLPTWPNVTTGTGFIGKCLLANADTLCAAVSPLIDPDETLLEGFFERCVMNNYFGIGIDAKISLDFHHKREEHPEKCRSRAKNYMWYGVLGSKQLLQKTYKNLEQRVQLECDGQRIPLPHLQGIVILNIPSFMGGINFWGGTKEADLFLAPSFDDKILEVVAVFGSVQMAASRLINLQHHRIAQCQSIQINILGDEGVPIQVDGEAWIQPPGIIRILHKNRMQMLCRNRALENSLRTWEEKQRQSIAAQGSKHRASVPHDKARSSLTRQSMPSHVKPSFLGVHIEKTRQYSFSGPLGGSTEHAPRHSSVTFLERPLVGREPAHVLFDEEELHLLLGFIESATGLVKWIKILAISYNLEVDLYSLATKADKSLENIHPGGKILTGSALRAEFTKCVNAVKTLYEESCCLLHDRGDKLKLREDLENKLSVSLASMELELRKCVLHDTPTGGMIYLQALQEGAEPKRKGLFWMKFRRASSAHLHLPHQHQSAKTRDVASWGTQEVGTWLETQQLAEYIDSFVRNDIRGRELLTLARRDLKDLGVTKVGHVKRILQAIKDLNQGVN